MELLVAVVILALAVVLIYNTLVSRRNQCDNIFASIDALLKKRYNLIPNLVTLMKESMKYESGLLEKVTELRAKAMQPGLTPEQKIAIADELTQPREMFPSSLIAGWFRFESRPLFEIPEAERKNIDIKELLES